MKSGDGGAPPLAPGLYVVATPIGNLEDITLRALRVLKEVDLIACEDTRQTQKLLDHYGIANRTVSYHEHNEAERAAEFAQRLEQGARIALVSDAGMPCISDPGYRVVSAAVKRNVPIIPVPGPSAAMSALTASGFPTDSFLFSGFFPPKRGQRTAVLERVKDSDITIVFYEAPHRTVETVQDIVDILGPGRPIVIARELTKVHEEFLRGTAGEVLEKLKARGEVKGEVTLLIGKGPSPEAQIASARVTVRQRLDEIMKAESLDEKAALKKVAKERGISKSEAYRELQRNR